ncbi:MAG: acyltransferase [Ottowia sp.]|nr:acyltransferase [Ottowia sp.]
MRWGAGGTVHLADEVSIYAHTRLVLGDAAATPEVGLQIGARTIVNVGCYLSGEGGLDIGEDVLIGAHVRLLSAGHAIDEGSAIIARNRITRAQVTVRDGAWIGAGATILEGVAIGRGAVVAAGAVVRSDVPDGAIAAGVPARIIRQRRRATARAEGKASWLTRCWRRLSGWSRHD